MSDNNNSNMPARETIWDTAAQRFEQTHGADPAKEFRLSQNGMELIKDEYFEPTKRIVTLEDFHEPQNELQRIIKLQELRIQEIRDTRRALVKLGIIKE